ncbi:MAG: thiamine phosphate synthase [Gemmatimonadota bacterium]
MRKTGRRTAGSELVERLRLMVLTAPRPACGRPLALVVRECLEAGATAIQLRDKAATPRELYVTATDLASVVAEFDALLLVNDRFDVAVAAGAQGVHLGPEDLPVSSVRRVSPPGFVIGTSTDDPKAGRRAALAGADYLGIGAVYGTRSKPGLEHESIGPGRVREVLEESGLPGVGIGGITPQNASDVVRAGAGIAVLSAVMDATEPGAVVRAFRAAMDQTA